MDQLMGIISNPRASLSLKRPISYTLTRGKSRDYGLLPLSIITTMPDRTPTGLQSLEKT